MKTPTPQNCREGSNNWKIHRGRGGLEGVGEWEEWEVGRGGGWGVREWGKWGLESGGWGGSRWGWAGGGVGGGGAVGGVDFVESVVGESTYSIG